MDGVVEGRYAYSAWRAATRGEKCAPEDYLPTGLGGVEGHPQPGLYRKRDGGGYVDGKRQPHSWVPVKIYLTDEGGNIVHRWREGLSVRACVGIDQDTDPHKVWLWCQKTVNGVSTLNAITQDEYNHWIQHGRWSDDAPAAEDQPKLGVATPAGSSTAPATDAASAGIGHNSAGDPEGYENLVALLDQEQLAVEAWISQQKEGAQAATLAKNWRDKILELERRVVAAFRKEKKPHWDMCVAIDKKWSAPQTRAAEIKRKMDAAFNAIARREQDRLQAIANAEAARKAAELRAQQEAERAAQEEARQLAAQEALERHRNGEVSALIPEPLPPPPPPPIVVAEQVRVTFGSGRKAAPKVPVKVAVITDWRAAAAHYAMATKVQAAVQALANADAKKGIQCPGAALQDEVAA